MENLQNVAASTGTSSSIGFRAIDGAANKAVSATEKIRKLDVINKAQTQATSLAGRIQSMGSLRTKINDIVNVAVKSAEASSSEINQALSAWDSMSDSQKQAMVNKANREGLYGCTGGCTVEGAENYADGLR